MNHPQLDMPLIRKRLENQRRALLAESLESLASRGTVMLDQTAVGRLSRMDALQAQAMAEAEEDRRQLQIRRIDNALLRIDNAELGECIECGEWIGTRRLESDPTLLKCIECAA
ncbi:TraR/DksA family transcriptional regulator [Halomonas sediminis]|uniref:TraR/DksA family transcriptional regulator n=1 Tax=Vreelandella zhuhanensis TaxID=2684210 RepID=A0A7X3H189_9GAMM|nr:TraR/DksA family transcriptional regulator [Halomonas zhuhanensis]MWJ28519.1 TraR/DksA family transcriptional regulator [Halomonas zhuhanensis]